MPANSEPTADLVHRMERRPYAGLMGTFILLGYTVVGLTVVALRTTPAHWYLPVLGLLFAYGGLEVSSRTADWRGSLAGNLFANLGLGLLLAPLVLLPGATWLRSAGLVIWVGTAVLAALAWSAPRVVQSFGAFLVAFLLAFGVLHATAPLWTPLLSDTPPPGLAGGLLGVAYLAFTDKYWTRALELARTLDNAADSACAIYAGSLDSLLSLLDS